jgi:hypothetical protein
MTALLEQTIIEHLHALDDGRLAEVLDFVEFLRQRTPVPPVPLTGLFSQDTLSGEDEDPITATLAELRRERMESLERSIALIESD